MLFKNTQVSLYINSLVNALYSNAFSEKLHNTGAFAIANFLLFFYAWF